MGATPAPQGLTSSISIKVVCDYDATVSANGDPVSPGQRLEGITARYGADSVQAQTFIENLPAVEDARELVRWPLQTGI